jgi:serine/threonine-protein kinase
MARDNDIDRDVAIKRLRSQLQSSHATVLRFAEEVRTVGRLEHPNIVPIHDVGVHPNGEYFFVMKYVHGETLESIIDKLAAGDPEYHRNTTSSVGSRS